MLRPAVVVPTLAVGAVVVGLVAYLFQPWKLWVDDVVNQGIPGAAGSPPPAASEQGGPGGSGPRLQVLASGRFVSHEHPTSGTVRVLRLPSDTRVLRIEDLDTSNGPALRVWVTDAPVVPGRNGWFLFDDGRHVDLGSLKGNIGNQNYPLPPGVDIAVLHSVTIWCERFHVSFGAAELGPVKARPIAEHEKRRGGTEELGPAQQLPAQRPSGAPEHRGVEP